MSACSYYETFDGVRQDYLLQLSPGGEALYAQVDGGIYPGDAPYIARRLANPSAADPLIAPEYLRFAAGLCSRGVALQRLWVVDETRYPPDALQASRAAFRKLQRQTGEQVRVAAWQPAARQLVAACGRSSPFVQAYMHGSQEGNPKVGFWLGRPARALSNVPWFIATGSYHNGNFGGFTVCEPPFSAELLQYVDFWTGVYAAAKGIRKMRLPLQPASSIESPEGWAA